MVSEFFSSATGISVSGQPSNRPVRLRSKSLSPNFLFLETQCESSSNRRFHSGLVRDDSLRLSTDLSHSPGPSTSRESRMYSDSDSSILAQEGLVHEIAQSDSRYTTDSTRQERPSETTNREIFPPKSQSFPLGSMENLKQPLSTTDFSEGVEKLVEASLGEGTRKDYKAKFQRYQNWCLGRGLYPRSAPLKDILEFLAEFHQEGLAYNTLCGYRSMLSLYHDPIDGISLGSHPLIGKLLKGVFNLNPPLKKFCPEWEVSIVLDFLTKEPFVPVESCALKFLTLKVCFLPAITSARRADDISKLSITPSNCRLFDNKVILIRDMLIKQDRPSHVGLPIEIEAYETDVNLCLVKLLPFYLTKVQNLRQRGCDSLFVTFVRPHKKPTGQTISRWLVQLIRLAY